MTINESFSLFFTVLDLTEATKKIKITLKKKRKPKLKLSAGVVLFAYEVFYIYRQKWIRKGVFR